MAIKSHLKVSTEFSSTALINVVFLLLIFFLLTSVLVSPHAVKLLLPTGSGKIISKQSATVYINAQNLFFVNESPATEANIQLLLTQALIGQSDGVIVLQADRKVPVQHIVTVIEAVNQMNNVLKTRHKIILATRPEE